MIARNMITFLTLACIVTFVYSSVLIAGQRGVASGPARTTAEIQSPDAVTDTPVTFVNEDVFSYAIADTKLFWNTLLRVNCDPDVHTKTFDEYIRREALQGSIVRDLLAEESQNT